MKIHELKCIAPYFQYVNEGKKKFEIRLNDRDYKFGDVLYLREYKPLSDTYTGHECLVKVDYILQGYPAVQEGYVIMSITKLYDF